MARPRDRLLTPQFFLAGLANLIHGLAIFMYIHLPAWLQGEFQATEVTVGWVVGVMSGAAIAARPFIGSIMDRSGRRRVILGGGVLHVLACALYLGVDSIGPLLIAVRLIQGVAEGAVFASLFTYAADIVPPSRRAEGIGIFGISGLLPVGLGGLLGDVVSRSQPWSTFFAVSIGLALLALLVSLPLREPPRQASTAGSLAGFMRALRQPNLVRIWFVGSAFAMGLSATFVFMRAFTERHPEVGTAGWFFLVYSFTAIVVRLTAGWVPDRIGLKRVLFPMMVVVAASVGTIAVVRSPWMLAVAGVLAGIGHGFCFPIMGAMTVERTNPASRGAAVAIFTAIFDAGMFLGGPAFGFVAEVSDLRTMYLVASVVPLLGVAVFAVWDRSAN